MQAIDIRVVIAIVINCNNQVLISKRQSHQHLAGYWEFPGGKIDPGETAQQALLRELKEELNIVVREYSPLYQFSYSYPEKTVLFDVFHVLNFQGELQGNEGQIITWVPVNKLSEFKLPAANQQILQLVTSLT